MIRFCIFYVTKYIIYFYSIINQLEKQNVRTKGYQLAIKKESLKSINTAIRKIEAYERNLDALNPENVLKRGYSITYYNGKILKSAETVNVGEKINVFVYMDIEKGLMGTLKTVFGQVGELAYLNVVNVSEMGAFLDLGIGKDVLLLKN